MPIKKIKIVQASVASINKSHHYDVGLNKYMNIGLMLVYYLKRTPYSNR